MSCNKYILIGHAVDFAEVSEILSQNREVVYLDYDMKTWESVGRKITIKQYDEMASNWSEYQQGTFFVDAQIVKNRGAFSIAKGKYDFWMINRVI